MRDDYFVDRKMSSVEVWSTYRLQFDNPRSRPLKEAIGSAVSGMARPGQGQILTAVYKSLRGGYFDVENVLFYNVGTAKFAQPAANGVRFECAFGQPPPCPVPLCAAAEHHHKYTFADAGAPFENWREGSAAFSWDRVPIPVLNEQSKPDGIWYSIRKLVANGAGSASLAGSSFALRMVIEYSPSTPVRPAAILKPLVDGVVAAFHRHDGTDLEPLARMLAQKLGRPEQEVSDLLTRQEAPLGTRRLLWTFRSGYLWGPGDDQCVAGELIVRPTGSASGWLLSGKLIKVSPAR
jgi:hypothetical protein